ncbi:MAG: hypothetical protein IKP36_06165 [Bacteroidaceae bacterium]|nr:hypothetical protein [Bacteroidaceae bacterium]
MNSTLALNADFLRDLSVVAEDENLLTKAVKYIRKLAAQKEYPTLMTKEEFFKRIDKAKEGPTYSMLPGENLTSFLKRQGYDL